jgi:hypothetical protein
VRRPLHSLAVAVAALVLVSCGGDDEAGETTTTSEPTVTVTTEPATTTTSEPEVTTTPPLERPVEIRVRVVEGAPQGGIVREQADKGDRVVVLVTSDLEDHVHVHGYDRFADVGPGQRARITFRATIPGRFLIELEDRHAQIAELTVSP